MLIPTPPVEFLEAVAGYPVNDVQHAGIGKELFDTIRAACELRPTDTVLDIGCGCGRIAVPLTGYLTSGAYEGFDIVLPMVKWCQENITSRHPKFRFTHADLRNTLYRDRGEDAAEYAFPYPDDTFDAAFATSVFTHLVPSSARQYARQIARVLKKRGGRGLLTFYLTHDDYRERKSRGEIRNVDFPHQRDGYSVADDGNLEAVTAFEEADAVSLLTEAGLVVRYVSRRWWSGNKDGLTYQDAISVTR